jgi:hypothetical protein
MVNAVKGVSMIESPPESLKHAVNDGKDPSQ